MSGSSNIQSVLIGIEYQNCRQTLDAYLLFAIWMGQIQSKLVCILTCNLWTGQFNDNFNIRRQFGKDV